MTQLGHCIDCACNNGSCVAHCDNGSTVTVTGNDVDCTQACSGCTA